MIFIESRESILQINSHGLLDVVDFFHHENKQLYKIHQFWTNFES